MENYLPPDLIELIETNLDILESEPVEITYAE